MVVAADQWTKSYVLSHVSPGPHHLYGPLGLDVSRNHGVAFSLLTGESTLDLVIAATLSLVVLVLALRAATPLAGLSFGLLLGGALGNDVDRVLRPGGVVDFVTLPHFATFNVADFSITLGAVLLVALVVLRRGILAPRR